MESRWAGGCSHRASKATVEPFRRNCGAGRPSPGGPGWASPTLTRVSLWAQNPPAAGQPCLSLAFVAMPLYELFAVAKPRLPKQQLADIMRAIGQTVMDQGGVVTDIKSYGERKLAYDIRQPGVRYSEVSGASSPSPSSGPLPGPTLPAPAAPSHSRPAMHLAGYYVANQLRLQPQDAIRCGPYPSRR